MELRDLKYFLACLDARSISGAARRVHAAQPTLSHALARLEQELGERLIERSTRSRLQATEVGTLLAARARAALRELAQFGEELSELRGQFSGQLRVCAIASLVATLVPGVLTELAVSHPALSVSVRTVPAERVVHQVLTGRAEIGLVAGAPPYRLKHVKTRLLFEEPLMLLVRSDDPLFGRKAIALRKLEGRPLLLAPRGTFGSEIFHAACTRAGFSPRAHLTLASAEALREATRAGLGASILPANYAKRVDASLSAVRLVQPTPVREVHLVERNNPGNAAPRSSTLFVKALEKQLTQLHERLRS